jgi:hypothetical protein
MPGQYLFFADMIISEETISGLGVCPILANPWDASTSTVRELLQQFAKSLAQPHISELAVR